MRFRYNLVTIFIITPIVSAYTTIYNPTDPSQCDNKGHICEWKLTSVTITNPPSILSGGVSPAYTAARIYSSVLD
jgi:hypothetical protein